MVLAPVVMLPGVNVRGPFAVAAEVQPSDMVKLSDVTVGEGPALQGVVHCVGVILGGTVEVRIRDCPVVVVVTLVVSAQASMQGVKGHPEEMELGMTVRDPEPG